MSQIPFKTKVRVDNLDLLVEIMQTKDFYLYDPRNIVVFPLDGFQQ